MQKTDTLAPAAALPGESAAGAAIEVAGLAKSYGAIKAVDGIDFTVARGEIFAVLGPNGAGKTTILEILEGYRKPDAGTARVLGLDPQHDARSLKLRCGVMLQQDGLHPGLTAREVLQLYAGFFPQSRDANTLLDLVGLRDAAAMRCRRLSGGQKRRLALAVALAGKPELVFLDEPTTGMDPQARLATWEIIRGLRDAGATVLLTTHLMDEAERLADRVAIVDHGRLIALDTPRSLTRRDAAGFVRLVAEPGLIAAGLDALEHARGVAETQPGIYALETGDAPALLAELTAWLRDRGVTLTELRVGHSSLEEAYLRLTGQGERL